MRAAVTSNQSSGVLSSVSGADGVAVIAPGQTVAEGDWLDVVPISAMLSPEFA